MSLAAVSAPSTDFAASLRAEARQAPMSGISEIWDYGRSREGLIPLWVGEGDLPTPSFISDAATRALAAGETFYTAQRGIPELRQAIADYMGRNYGERFAKSERYFVTGGGMQAVQIALRLVAGAGDEVLLPTPAWPNFRAAMELNGAKAVPVQMDLKDRAWVLDVARLEAAVTPRTRAVFVNSPSNPTGWTASAEQIADILALARKHNLWIIADEIYGRFVYDGSARAPSFHDVIDEADRVMFVQTFSKNWAMTGWRIGWLEAPPELGQTIENLIQYSTSGVAVFMQRAAIVALERGESFLEHQIARAKVNRDLLENGLSGSNRISFARANGAFYFFFSVAGYEDSTKLAKDLIDRSAVGLAPGSAFGPGAEKFLRLCFARRSDHIEETVRRIASFLG